VQAYGRPLSFMTPVGAAALGLKTGSEARNIAMDPMLVTVLSVKDRTYESFSSPRIRMYRLGDGMQDLCPRLRLCGP
jgi:hypothetical protein